MSGCDATGGLPFARQVLLVPEKYIWSDQAVDGKSSIFFGGARFQFTYPFCITTNGGQTKAGHWLRTKKISAHVQAEAMSQHLPVSAYLSPMLSCSGGIAVRWRAASMLSPGSRDATLPVREVPSCRRDLQLEILWKGRANDDFGCRRLDESQFG